MNRRIRNPSRSFWRLIGSLIGACVATLSFAWADESAQSPVAEIRIGYIHGAPSKAKLSLLDIPAANDGVAGLQLAIEDSNTTGQFLNQKFVVVDKLLMPRDDPAAASLALADQGVSFVVADLDATALLKAADAGKARGQIFLNAGAIDDRLREEDCRPNVIHVAPTRSMLADALAQYLVWKKWRKWLLVVGSHPADKLLGDAYRRSALRFGAKIVNEREFTDTGGARRTDSGIVEIQREIPVFTQEAPDYDVLVAADENEVFAGYLPYRSWDARLVAGSAGLMPTTWNGAFDQWGAIQLQSRFAKAFHRAMSALDMQSWSAGRIVGEAAARAKSTDPQVMLNFIKSADFSLAAFKGQKLTLRDWNLQLRQPILLFDGRNNVSVSPQEGFLHQVSELDTLGIDRPETKCKLN